RGGSAGVRGVPGESTASTVAASRKNSAARRALRSGAGSGGWPDVTERSRMPNAFVKGTGLRDRGLPPPCHTCAAHTLPETVDRYPAADACRGPAPALVDAPGAHRRAERLGGADQVHDD